VYQFGVYTGIGLTKIAALLGNTTTGRARFRRPFGHLFGFDSFQGISPTSDAHGERERVNRDLPHSWAGAYLVADALGEYDVERLMRQVKRLVARPNTALIPGFFNKSLTDDLLPQHRVQPASLLDLDVDIYLSTVQAGSWMLRHGLVVPGTYIRYDDWPGMDAESGPPKGTREWGQALVQSHRELVQQHGLEATLLCEAQVGRVPRGSSAHCRC